MILTADITPADAAKRTGAVILAAAALLLPKAAAQGVRDGLELCLSTVVPSLLMLMFSTILLVECGLAQRVGRLLAPAAAFLFGLPGEAGAALLLSVLGGYPAGAKAVRGLYERGAVTLEQAQRMSCFCFCAGPAFLIGTVGAVAGGAASGVILLAAQLIVLPIMGVLCSFPREKRRRKAQTETNCPPRVDFAGALVSSAHQAASAMLSVCLFVVIFSALLAMLNATAAPALCTFMEKAGMPKAAALAVIPVALEVTGGCCAAASCGLPAVAFAVGFGGISVQMQVFSLLGECVCRWRFFAARLIHGLLSAAVTALLLKLMPVRAVAAAATPRAALSSSATGAATLLLMCVMCIVCLPSDGKTLYKA